MKKMNLIFTLGLMMTFMSSLSFAGVVISGGGTGDLNNYLTCRNDDLHFVIRGTAVPTFKQGLLTTQDGGGERVKFKCNHLKENLVPGQPSAGTLLWSCEQYPAHDGSYVIRVEQSGVTGMTSAYLLRQQAYPLEPQAVATLHCR